MAFEKPVRSSSRSTLTSIASILERSIPSASSYDRLSFKSVAKDYEGESRLVPGRPRKSKADMRFRAISPALNFNSLPLSRAPLLEQAKSCTPSIYQQMALSELDLVKSGAETTHVTDRKEKNTNEISENSNQLREPETADLIDLSATAEVAAANNSSGEENFSTIKRRVGFTDSTKPSTEQQADDSKIKTFDDLLSLTFEPKVVVFPTIQKEESRVYHRRPGLMNLPEDSSQKIRQRNMNPARLRPQLTLSSDDSSVMAADVDCPIHGHVREVEDVTVTLSNPVVVEDLSALDGQAIGKQATTAVMSKKSTDSKRYKHIQGSEKSSNSTSVELLNDEDYYAGVTYSCKYIGSMSMMKPTSKLEILSAMRRVRIEYKTRNTKKKKVLMEIGVNGVKVRLNKRKRKELMDASRDDLLLMEEPVHHIFYVSHDSHDNKIFSYISKKNPSLSVTSAAAKTNVMSQQTEPSTFHCHVFKACKRLQAVLIIQGLGRIFTICQFLPKSTDVEASTNGKLPEVKSTADPAISQSLEDSVFLPEEKTVRVDNSKNSNTESARSNHKGDKSSNQQELQRKKLLTSKQKSCDDLQLGSKEAENDEEGPSLTQQQEVQLLWLQVEHQEQQIGLAVSEMEVLKQQVAIENQARHDAEVRCHQLLLHNKDLLEHINRLVVENKQLRERINPDRSDHNITQPILSSTRTASPSNSRQVNSDTSRSVKTSPDSGHKEMSARSSQSDILSSKFEQEMLQKKLCIDRDFSFTDMAKLRLSQSQLPSHNANQSESRLHAPMPTAGQSNGVDELDQLIKQLDEEAAEMKSSNGLANEIEEDKLHIANCSFSETPISSPVVPHSRTPDGF